MVGKPLKKPPQSLLEAVSQQLKEQQRLKQEEQAILEQSKRRGEVAGQSAREVHKYLTDEDKAAKEGRQTTKQQLSNEVIARQIREKQAQQATEGESKEK